MAFCAQVDAEASAEIERGDLEEGETMEVAFIGVAPPSSSRG